MHLGFAQLLVLAAVVGAIGGVVVGRSAHIRRSVAATAAASFAPALGVFALYRVGVYSGRPSVGTGEDLSGLIGLLLAVVALVATLTVFAVGRGVARLRRLPSRY